MSNIITVQNLGKKYLISHQKSPRYLTLRDSISESVRTFFQRDLGGPLFKNESKVKRGFEDYWALRDVTFEVEPGDRIGIIGRNGAGKSTLLKILSRITHPTTGKVNIKGRVASLLEVGTGFSPELTGRENIYLNGAILGMTKRDIQKRFDEIVAFSEIEIFLDTPVKRYSSGMYVRLSFAVAAHLDPEILMIDEVLAVGDAKFQKKCLGKMDEVSSKEGRTILFVSHQMGAIAQLCSKAMLIDKGHIIKAGDTKSVIDYYRHDTYLLNKDRIHNERRLNNDVYISKVQSLNSQGKIISQFAHDEEINISFNCHINKWLPNLNIGFFVEDKIGRRIFTTENREWSEIQIINNKLHLCVTIPSNFLVPGQYYFTFFVSIPRVRFVDWVENILTITIVDMGSKFLMYEGGDYGCVFADCKWNLSNDLTMEK